MGRYRFLQTPFQAFAHRGGNETATENSLEAFAHAYALGFRYLETDVHLTRDGVLVAFHDTDLSRLTGRPDRIEDLSAAEIRAMRLPDGGHIPTLADLFDQFPDAYFNIDAKVAQACVPLAAAINAHGVHDRVCIGSFHDQHIKAVCRQLSQPVCRSMGTSAVKRFYFGSMLALPQPFSADCIQLPMRIGDRVLMTPQRIAYAHRLGLKVHVWTVNDKSLMSDLIDMGVDGIMTDRISVLRALLERRNLWVSSN